jgi:hypothetical protein
MNLDEQIYRTGRCGQSIVQADSGGHHIRLVSPKAE